MLETIFNVLGAPGFGALTGLLGGWATKRENRKMAELQFAHDEKMMERETEQMKIENAQVIATMDKQIDVAEAESEIAVAGKEADAFTESIKQQGVKTGIAFVDAIRSLMRPVLTVALLFITWHIYDNLDELVGGLKSLPQTDLVALFRLVIHQIIFLTVTAVAWWFASRGDKNLRTLR